MRSALAFLVGTSLALASHAQTPNLTSVEPAPNLVGVLHEALVVAHFDQPIDLASVTPASFRVSGRWSGSTSGTYALANGDATVVFTPSEPFGPGEEVTLQVTGAVAAQNGSPLAQAWTSKFWAEALPASLDFGTPFTFTTQYPGTDSTRPYGGFGGDFDDDGFPDLAVVCEDTNDVRIYTNDGTGGFPDPPTMHFIGGTPSPSEGGDFNGDGWLDLTVTGAAGVGIFLNDGAGNLQAPTVYAGSANAHGMAVLDYDTDGDEDIAITNTAGFVSFLANDGAGNFIFGGTTPAPIGAWGLDSGDANNDGIDDLFVGGSTEMRVLLGDGAGNFASAGSVPTSHVWQLAAGDLDADGNLDVVGSATSGQTYFAYGDGAGNLGSASSAGAGFFSVASDLGDIDGDGDLDAIASDFGAGRWAVFENLGSRNFAAPFFLDAPDNASCALIADFDGDGRMEVIGFDEISDDLLVWDIGHADVQGCANSACLRVNGSTSSGLLGAPSVDVPQGSLVTFEVQSHANRPYGIYWSPGALAPGFPLKWGTLNLNLVGAQPLVLGVTAPPRTPFTSTGFGLSSFPANLPLGTTIVTQGFVLHPGPIATGLHFTNPVSTLIVP